ncbi:class I SAM-dependent methyltransferase [Rhodocaloribacter litoris]|uniref:class I SAM-dependent methyltransferase n=1 Tax=Rhodocaloribacter litoris TaxID=2558931 RepID=UPI00141E1486|nr:class I SAM-dependent methyltransferase [Rhodocaloribacter litoris]QXD14295.1 class I SAM-dependent methyltransferase [Rhodocaloribacter litoris]
MGNAARILYEDEPQGTADVSHRLTSNTAMGTFDFTACLRDCMALTDGLAVLDVGCGPGHHLADFLEHYDLDAHGVDPYLEEAPRHRRLAVRRASAEALPYPDGRFDRVMCNYALYYVDAWPKALDEMLRVLRTGGRFVLSGPGTGNNGPFYALHRRLFGEISEIDRHALGFLERAVEPELERRGLAFTAETHENRITYPTLDAFLAYYTTTTLFRMTARTHAPEAMIAAVRDELAPGYARGEPFVNVKHVRIVSGDV